MKLLLEFLSATPPIDFFAAWKFYAIGPLIVAGVLSLVFVLLHFWLARLGGASRKQLARFKDRCIQLAMWLVYIACVIFVAPCSLGVRGVGAT